MDICHGLKIFIFGYLIYKHIDINQNYFISDWRQGKSNLRKIKRFFRKAQQLKRSTSKNDDKKAERKLLIINAHKAYIELVQSCIDKSKQTIDSIQFPSITSSFIIDNIKKYITDADKQIDQIRRRVKGKLNKIKKRILNI